MYTFKTREKNTLNDNKKEELVIDKWVIKNINPFNQQYNKQNLFGNNNIQKI